MRNNQRSFTVLRALKSWIDQKGYHGGSCPTAPLNRLFFLVNLIILSGVNIPYITWSAGWEWGLMGGEGVVLAEDGAGQKKKKKKMRHV